MCLLVSSVIGLSISIPAFALKRKIPFGPELIAGTLVCAALAQPILAAFN
jgi:hypothetical protein